MLVSQLIAVACFCAILCTEWRRRYFEHISIFVHCLDGTVYVRLLLRSVLFTVFVASGDLFLRRTIQGIQHPLLKAALHVGGWLGGSIRFWLIVFPVYAISLVLQKPIVRARVFGCLLSVAVASLLCTVIKWIIARARPYSHLGPLSFFNWSRVAHHGSMFQSFPSGDTIVVAATAWYVVSWLPRSSLRWLILVLPLMTALSRVFLDQHWSSDTMFSIGLALVSARLIVQYERFTAQHSETEVRSQLD